MRLIYVTVGMPYGPGEPFFISETKALLDQQCDLLIVPRSPAKTFVHDEAKELKSRTLRKPLLSGGILATAMLEAACHPRRFLRVLRWLSRSENARVLLKNLAVLPKGLWLGSVARKWRADHLHAHWATATSTMVMVASEFSGIPWSFTAHRGDIVENNLLGLKAERAAFMRMISESGLRLVESVAGSDAAQSGCVIHMGVPIPEHVDAKRPPSRPARLLCPANLYPVKGHTHLLQAMATLKAQGVECALELAGGGPLLQQLQAETAALGIEDRVTFLGQTSHDDIVTRYQKHQTAAVVLPSVDLGDGMHEGIPVALMEAMAYAVPVVSTLTGGIPELLRDGAGMLVRPADPAALAEAIGQLVGNAALHERVRIAGRERILQEFAVRRTVQALMARFEAAGPARRRSGSEAEVPAGRKAA